MASSWNVPNILTLIRMALVPVIIVSFYLPGGWGHYVCALIFFLAGVTDWLDGMLARYLKQETQFGAFIDPVADKLMVVVSLVLLIDGFHSLWITIPAIIIIGREIVISALREWMAEIGKRSNISVNIIGKFKTMVQMFAVFMLLLAGTHNFNWYKLVGLIALYIASVLTIWSMFVYLRASWGILKD